MTVCDHCNPINIRFFSVCVRLCLIRNFGKTIECLTYIFLSQESDNGDAPNDVLMFAVGIV